MKYVYRKVRWVTEAVKGKLDQKARLRCIWFGGALVDGFWLVSEDETTKHKVVPGFSRLYRTHTHIFHTHPTAVSPVTFNLSCQMRLSERSMEVAAVLSKAAFDSDAFNTAHLSHWIFTEEVVYSSFGKTVRRKMMNGFILFEFTLKIIWFYLIFQLNSL